ncbi:L-arabinose transport system permease protein [Salmonella enterica subsp. arizonae]|uniref:L-arabinose transport system permease protein n=2 Tax=Salmonella enterica subsp. arizonae TaxID=59203 RepID=A0A379TA74_SALER|nr:L-arabinose transport system permease protein [Salmonella enterica subsp. arizonae]SUG42301.1 L-arabinose transport system permease protein [Salmonella enterica subsp. arizonae]SUG47281.1 L-arabinose transport system permease protein [Salmonella enterica subsp. arizonae]
MTRRFANKPTIFIIPGNRYSPGAVVSGFEVIKIAVPDGEITLNAIIQVSHLTSAQPMTSLGYELIVMSACVLGGVFLQGGIGKISYVVAGVLILGTVENAMSLLTISPFAQYVVRGLIVLAAVIFDRYKQKSKRTI